MLERPQGDEPVILDHTDDIILICKFCNLWHDPKKQFIDYFQRYIERWFKLEHKNYNSYIKGNFWIYDRDDSHIFYKWNITNKDGKKWTYDLAVSYDNLLNFIINLETKWKLSNILFDREQETLKPKYTQGVLF